MKRVFLLGVFVVSNIIPLNWLRDKYNLQKSRLQNAYANWSGKNRFSETDFTGDSLDDFVGQWKNKTKKQDAMDYYSRDVGRKMSNAKKDVIEEMAKGKRRIVKNKPVEQELDDAYSDMAARIQLYERGFTPSGYYYDLPSNKMSAQNERFARARHEAKKELLEKRGHILSPKQIAQSTSNVAQENDRSDKFLEQIRLNDMAKRPDFFEKIGEKLGTKPEETARSIFYYKDDVEKTNDYYRRKDETLPSKVNDWASAKYNALVRNRNNLQNKVSGMLSKTYKDHLRTM